MVTKKCPQCKKIFSRERDRTLFCSPACASLKNKTRFQPGHKPYRHWLGKKLSIEHRNNLSKSHKGKIPSNIEQFKRAKIGEDNYQWRGDNVGYVALHQWVYKKLGNPMICEFCNQRKDNNRQIHWANKSHKYKRDLEDWIRLCVKCHRKYDHENKAAKI